MVVCSSGRDKNALIKALKIKEYPLVVVANTVKGKGVSFMENNNEWHYRNLTEDLYKKALKELK